MMMMVAFALIVSLVAPRVDAAPAYMSDVTKSIAKTTRYFDGCKPACGWSGNVLKPTIKGPVKGCSVVKPGAEQERVDPNAYSACSDGGTSYACLDTTAFTENGQRYAFAAIELDITSSSNTVSCCECYEATILEGPMEGETIHVQMINNGVGAGSGILDLHVVGAGHGYNNVVAKNSADPVPFGGTLGKTGASSAPMFSESDWGPQDNLWGKRFSYYNNENSFGYAGGISSACSSQQDCFEKCEALPAPAVEACKWEFADDGMRGASVPRASLRRIKCPEALHSRSGCLLAEDQAFNADEEEPSKSPEEPTESPEETPPPVHPHEGKHTPFFSSTCEDTIWEINYNTQEPEIYSCEDYKGKCCKSRQYFIHALTLPK